MKKMLRILGKRGRITIPFEIRQRVCLCKHLKLANKQVCCPIDTRGEASERKPSVRKKLEDIRRERRERAKDKAKAPEIAKGQEMPKVKVKPKER